jgi:Excalibur calcium-binding domain
MAQGPIFTSYLFGSRSPQSIDKYSLRKESSDMLRIEAGVHSTGECRMARVGAKNASHAARDNATWTTAFFTIILCIAGNVSAHGGGLDKHGCYNDRKRGGYHCHRSPAPSSRRDSTPRYDFAPSRNKPALNLRGQGVFANCSEARAAGAAPVRRGEPGYGPHLDRDGDGVGCEPRRR